MAFKYEPQQSWMATGQMKALENENVRFKRMYAELSLGYQALQDIVRKGFKVWRPA